MADILDDLRVSALGFDEAGDCPPDRSGSASARGATLRISSIWPSTASESQLGLPFEVPSEIPSRHPRMLMAQADELERADTVSRRNRRLPPIQTGRFALHRPEDLLQPKVVWPAFAKVVLVEKPFPSPKAKTRQEHLAAASSTSDHL